MSSIAVGALHQAEEAAAVERGDPCDGAIGVDAGLGERPAQALLDWADIAGRGLRKNTSLPAPRACSRCATATSAASPCGVYLNGVPGHSSRGSRPPAPAPRGRVARPGLQRLQAHAQARQRQQPLASSALRRSRGSKCLGRDEQVDGGQAGRQRLAPGRGLHRREAHARPGAPVSGCMPISGIDQHVQPRVDDGLRPGGQRRRRVHEARRRRAGRARSRRRCARSSWNRVSSMRSRSRWRTQPCVMAFHTEWSRTCAAAMPTRSLRGHRRERRGERARRRDAGGHQARGRLAVRRQQRLGVDRVVGEIEGLGAADGPARRRRPCGREPGVESASARENARREASICAASS